MVAGGFGLSGTARAGVARLLDLSIGPLVSHLPTYQHAQAMAANAINAVNQKQLHIKRQADRIAELEWELETLRQKNERTVERRSRENETLAARLRLLSSQLINEARSNAVSVEYQRDASTVIRVGNQVLYDKGSAELKREGQALLELVARTLQDYGDAPIRVEGHTDDLPIASLPVRAKYPTNWHLSVARAATAAHYLETAGGVAARRLQAVGYGEHRPVAANDTEAGRAENRRIEIVVGPKSTQPAPGGPLASEPVTNSAGH